MTVKFKYTFIHCLIVDGRIEKLRYLSEKNLRIATVKSLS